MNQCQAYADIAFNMSKCICSIVAEGGKVKSICTEMQSRYRKVLSPSNGASWLSRGIVHAIVISLAMESLPSFSDRAFKSNDLLACAYPTKRREVLLHLLDKSLKGVAREVSCAFLCKTVSDWSLLNNVVLTDDIIAIFVAQQPDDLALTILVTRCQRLKHRTALIRLRII